MEGVAANLYLDAILRGDPSGAKLAVDELLNQLKDPLQVVLSAITPALHRVGDLWHQGKLSVAEEHLATQISYEVLERLEGSIEPSREVDSHCVVCTVEGEDHALGARIVSGILRKDGWRVDFLGANLPPEDLLEFCSTRSPDLLVLSVTLLSSLEKAREVISNLKEHIPSLRVLVGGAASIGEAGKQSLSQADEILNDVSTVAHSARSLVGISKERSLEEYLERIGNRVRDTRRAMGLNQKELAERSGLDRTYVSTLERGQQNLSLAALLKLAKALECDLEKLI